MDAAPRLGLGLLQAGTAQELSSTYTQEGAKPRSRLSWMPPAWAVWLWMQLEMMDLG